MRRRLPTQAEALAILAQKRTLPQRRPPPPAARALGPILKVLDSKHGEGAGALQARWREIVGPEIARRTEPVKLTKARGGAPALLEIRVAGPAAAIIQHQAHEIMARVNLFLGGQAVGKIRVVQGPLRTKPDAGRIARRPQPLDAAQEAALARDLAAAPEGPLKQALMSLGRGVLRRGR